MKKQITLLLSVLLIVGLLPVQTALSAEQTGENVALHKPVTVTSAIDGYLPEYLVDGDLNTCWARSELAPNEGFIIDLGEPHRINSVVLYTRNDIDHGDYRKRVALEFSNTPDFSVKERVMALTDDDPGFCVPVEVTPPSKTPYRYVRAVKTDIFIFVLAEIEIYGYVLDTNTMELGTDVAGHKNEGPITLLSYLGLTEGVNDDIFGVDHLLTRAQAASSVVKAFGSTSGVSGYLPFSDVDPTHKYYNDILAAYSLGYVTGDGTTAFRPDDYATKRELLFMTLRAIGYDDVAPKKYKNDVAKMLNLAQRLDLLKNVSYHDYDENISRSDAARIFYNALLAPGFTLRTIEGDSLVFAEGDDLLRNRYRIVLTRGVVNENCISALDGDAKKSKNSANISGKSFLDPDGALDHYLGNSVVVATSLDEPEQILIAWPSGTNEEVVIPASKLDSNAADIAAGRIVALTADGKEQRYDLEDHFCVLKNGVAYPYYTDADLMLSNGQLRLLDNDKDSVYDVVFIEEYNLHYVAGAFSDEKEFTIVDIYGNRKTLQRETLTVKNGEGATESVSKIKKDTVIKLFSTPDGEHCTIVLYDAPIVGVLKARSDEEVTVGAGVYPLSPVYRNAVRSYEPIPGERVSAFVDELGEIIWIERDMEAIDAEWTIAFSKQINIGKGVDSALTFRVFTERGIWVDIDVADKVTVDGVSATRDALAKMVTAEQGSGRFELAMLRYKTDDAGKIKTLDTLTETVQEMALGTSFTATQYIGDALFSKEASSFWDYHAQIILAKNSTPTFVIPTVGNSFTTDSEFDEMYYVTTLENAAGLNSCHMQNIQCYMPDEDGYPSCFMKRGMNFLPGAGVSKVVSDEYAPIMLVEKVSTALLDGQPAVKISGYNILTQQNVIIYAESSVEVIESGLLYQEQPDCLDMSDNAAYKNQISVSALNDLGAAKEKYIHSVSDIGFGDLVRYELLGSSVRAMERIFDYDASALPKAGENPKQKTWYTVSGSYPEFYIGWYRFQFGTISNLGKNTFTAKTLFDTDETYLKSSYSKIIVCDTKSQTPRLIDGTDLLEFADDSHRIMVYSNNAIPRLAIVYSYSQH